MSDFNKWTDEVDAKQGLIFPENIGPRLSIDETSLSLGELYTVVTNKDARGKKGTIVAIINGTKSEKLIPFLNKIPERLRKKVKEITLDFAGNMGLIAKKCFPNADQVIDRFHVQQLVSEALQEIRVKYRWEALDQDNQAIERARKHRTTYQPEILSNGDTLKQLLARSRYLLYKGEYKWTLEQKERATILFEKYPEIQKAYKLTQELVTIFNKYRHREIALVKLALWNDRVERSGFKSFNTINRTINMHHPKILNYFNNRSTNASAESFNAKIKAFRSQFRGVSDINFFLFRLTKLFA